MLKLNISMATQQLKHRNLQYPMSLHLKNLYPNYRLKLSTKNYACSNLMKQKKGDHLLQVMQII